MGKTYKKETVYTVVALGIIFGILIGFFTGYNMYQALNEPICYKEGSRMLIQQLFNIC